MRTLRLLFVVTFIVAVFNNTLEWADMLLLLLSLFMMLLLTRVYPLLKHLGKYIILLTYWVSLVFMPAFHLVKNSLGVEGYGGYSITALDYNRILSFGAKVVFISSVLFLVLGIFNRRNQRSEFVYHPRPISDRTARLSLYFIFGLSLFSLSIGLSRMGSKGIELPFHLSGIINLLRALFYPILFAAIVENYILTRRRIPKTLILLFILWAVLEVFVRLSKGALISSVLPVALVLFAYYKPSFRTVIRVAAPFILVFLFLYPVIELMRSDQGAIKEGFANASSEVDFNSGDLLITPLNRAFMIPQMYAKDYGYLNQDQLFDFSRARAIISWGGSARYQTFVIDNFPLGAIHSSGTTGLQDPLLMGGYGLCFIVVILLFIFANMIDSISSKRVFSVYIALILFLWSLCNEQNISSFTDSVGLQYIITRLTVILVAYQLNFRNKHVVSS